MMYTNVIHRVDSSEAAIEALMYQQDTAHKQGFRTNLLMTFNAFDNPKIISYCQKQNELYNDELGLHLHELKGKKYFRLFDTNESMFYLLDIDRKRKVIDYMMTRFYQAFNYFPKSIGGYIIDSKTLQYIHEQYPTVIVAITNCFEEGIKMFQGNNHQWYLFSDGGPWGAYYPSKENHLCPAMESSEVIDIVSLPHLNRDMLLALTSRDDYFSSHPINVIRAKANEGSNSPYNFRFIDEWIRQDTYNEYVYYNIFVSSTWLISGEAYEEEVYVARKMYEDCLKYLYKKVRNNQVNVLTMSEFATWYKANIPINNKEVVCWKDVLGQSKKEILWFVDSTMRVAIDTNTGGNICDLRPLIGRVDRNLGIDEESLWNGNYPFIISTEHRGGFWNGTYHNLVIQYDKHYVELNNYRTGLEKFTKTDNRIVFVLRPVKIEVGEIIIKVQSEFEFHGEGKICIKRRILNVRGEAINTQGITLTEFHRGAYGTTEYPENNFGITMNIKDVEFTEWIDYQYTSKEIIKSNPIALETQIP